MRREVVRASAILPTLQHGRDPFPHLAPGADVAILLGTGDPDVFGRAFESLGYAWKSAQAIRVGSQVTILHIWRRSGRSTLHHSASSLDVAVAV